MGDDVAILPAVVEQHAEEAAFLWTLRRARLKAFDADLRGLAQLDGRLAANLEGLRHGGGAALAVCREAYRDVGEGEAFALAVLALEGGRDGEFAGLVAGSAEDPARGRALASALGWVGEESARPWIDRLTAAAEAPARRVGLAGAAVRRVDPGEALLAALDDPDPAARARARRAAGELGRVDLARRLRAALGDDDPAARGWGAWSLVRLTGDVAALDLLREEVETDGPLAAQALALAVRRMAPDDARAWALPWRDDPKARRRAAAAAAALGDAQAVPWLIEVLDDPGLGPLAGEAVAAVTGVDVAREGLRADPAAAAPEGDAGDDDAEPASGPEADLPRLDGAKVGRWWVANRGRFEGPGRWLLGGGLEPERLTGLLRTARQPYRAAAALELAVREVSAPLFEVRAPARVQRSRLG